MKKCSSCLAHKHISEFFVKNSDTGRLHAQCKSCYKEYRKNYYAAHYTKYREAYLERAKLSRKKARLFYQETISNYLKLKECESCGIKDPRVLEFDHIDPEEKLFSISQGLRLGYKISDVLEELKKCRILCANCHRIRTAEQFGWNK